MKTGVWVAGALIVSVAAAGAAGAQGDEPPPVQEQSGQARISLSERGTVAELLRAIAREGGLNLAVQGTLDAPAELHLKDVTAEEALRTLAKGWDLELDQQGSIWTVRARGGQAAAAAATPAPAVDPTDAAAPADGTAGPARVTFGRSLHVTADESVEKVVVYGGSARIDGRVTGNVTVFGGELELMPTARVGGNVDTFGGSVLRHRGARIDGQVRTIGSMRMVEPDESPAPSAMQSAPGASVVTPTPPAAATAASSEDAGEDSDDRREDAREEDTRTRAADFLSWFATLFVVGFVASMMAPERMKVVQKQIRRAPGVSAAVGLAATVALVPLTVLLLVTIVGIPIALLVLWPVAFLSVGVGFAAVALELGARIPVFRGRKSQALVLALGLVILLVVAQVPVLGPLVIVASSFCGFGAVLRTRFGRPGMAPLPAAVPV